MADAYANVVGGSLKLKGKKKGKSKRKRAEVEADADAEPDRAGDGSRAALDAADGVADGTAIAGLTKAQREHMRVLERNAKQKVEQDKSKSYRDRVSAMNEYLANLSEHHDIPRISKH